MASSADRSAESPVPEHAAGADAAADGASSLPLDRSVSTLAMLKDSLDSRRRESLDLEQRMPRKRVAVGVYGSSESESERSPEASPPTVNASIASETGDGRRRLASVGSDDADATARPIEMLEIDEMSLPEIVEVSEQSSSGSESPVRIVLDSAIPTQIDDAVTEITASDAYEGQSMMEQLILALDDNRPLPTSIESYVLQCRRAFQWQNPQTFLNDVNDFLSVFLAYPDDEKKHYWELAHEFFDSLPEIASDLWHHSGPLPASFWHEAGVNLCFAFYVNIVDVVSFLLKQDLALLRSMETTSPDSLKSPKFVKALHQFLVDSERSLYSLCETADPDSYTKLSDLAQVYYSHGVVDGVFNICIEILNAERKVDAELATAVIPHVDLLSSVGLYMTATQRLLERHNSSSDSSSSSSSSDPAETTGQQTQFEFPLSDFSNYMLQTDVALGKIVDSPDAPDRTLLLSIVGKLTDLFYIVMLFPNNELLKTHPALMPLTKNADPDDVESVRNYAVKIRKFYWFIKIFQCPRPEYKLMGIKTILGELQAVFREWSPSPTPQAAAVISYYATLLSASGFTKFLVSTEANSTIVAQFGSSIYAFLTVFSVISEKDLAILWDSMVSAENPVMFNAICSIFINIIHWLPETWLNWLIDKLLGMPLTTLEPTVLKLIKGIVAVYHSNAVKATEEHAAQSIPMNPYVVLLQVIKRAGNVTPEEEAEMKVSPTLLVNVLTSSFDTLMSVAPHTQSKAELFESHVTSLRAFGPDSLQDLTYINSYLENFDSETQPSPPRESPNIQILVSRMRQMNFSDVLVTNIKSWSNYCVNSSPSMSLYPLNASLRQDCLVKLLSLDPRCIADRTEMEELWLALYDRDVNNPEIKDAFWGKLTALANVLQERCDFMDYCFAKIATLPSDRLTPVCGSFIISYFNYESITVDDAEKFAPEKDFLLPGFDTFWHFCLKTEDESCLSQVSDIFIWLSIEADFVSTHPTETIEKFHRSLVRRCITEITLAGREIATNGDNVQEAAQIYTRSFKFLEAFLTSYRGNPRYAVDRSSASSTGNIEIVGAQVEFRLQITFGSPRSEKFYLGDENNVLDLFSMVANVVGDTQFRVFVLGSELKTPDFMRTLKDVGCRDTTAIMVVRGPPNEDPRIQRRLSDIQERAMEAESATGSTDIDASKSVLLWRPLRPAEMEIMGAYEQMYELLLLPDEFAILALDSITAIGPASSILETFSQPKEVFATWDQLYPSQKPYKTLYSDYVLECVFSFIQQGKMDRDTLSECYQYIVPRLVQFATEPDLAMSSDVSVRNLVRLRLLERIKAFLREDCQSFTRNFSVDEEIGSFVIRLISIADDTASGVAERVLDILLLSGASDARFWKSIAAADECRQLFTQCMLNAPNVAVRSYYATAILEFIQNALQEGSTESEDHAEVALYFWSLACGILPLPNSDAEEKAEALFIFSSALLKLILIDTRAPIDEYGLCSLWFSIIRGCKVNETLEKIKDDRIISGYARLMVCALEYRRSNESSVRPDESWLTAIIELLFPSFIGRNEEPKEEAGYFGCLAPDTRAALYRLLYLLAEDSNKLQSVAALFLKLLPSSPHVLHEGWNTDRSRWIRSASGYAGLQNLANTCYLNSFVNQLYMNTEFRSYIFGLVGVEEEASSRRDHGSQDLIPEIVRLFAYLRYGWMKVLDTRGFIQSIRNFENDPIDYTVQMDVDEFYNLLFDRLESKIAEKDKKEAISHFYGGTLLTQIKSKECEHVSERTEPFSAIQCDIKGKRDLEKSLDAFVEGETMDGENKYWCSQCSAHVDAEKRICLQEVPDHLIFHLKRFDFDLATMQRSKINDYFEFPTELDISPYMFSSLAIESADESEEERQQQTPDKFRISGVLVHTGTAESGHYFSYIRDKEGWVEFNDAETSRFDEAQIADMAFGGVVSNVNGELVEKPFSAYMLFYERVEGRPDEEKEARREKAEEEMRGSSLYAKINEDNKRLAMKWSLFGAEHVRFVTATYEDLSAKKAGDRSEIPTWAPHDQMMFDTFFQIAVRTKESGLATEMVGKMQESCVASERASMAFLAWISENETAMRGLLVRCPSVQIRQEVSRLIKTCLGRLQGGDGYGSLDLWTRSCSAGSDEEEEEEDSQRWVVFSLVRQLFDVLLCRNESSSAGRGSWAELNSLLLDIIINTPEDEGAALCICAGGLQASIAAVFDGRDDVAGIALIVQELLQKIDLARVPVDSLEQRCEEVAGRYEEERSEMQLPLASTEYELLCRGYRKMNNQFVQSLLEQDVPVEDVMKIVSDFLVRGGDGSPLSDIRIMFGTGTRAVGSASDAESARPFLQYLIQLMVVYQPTLTECKRLCQIILPMDAKSAEEEEDEEDEEAEEEGESGDSEAEFEIESTVTRIGEALAEFISECSLGRGGENMRRAVFLMAPGWAPGLVVHWNRAVRGEVVRALERLVFSEIDSERQPQKERERQAVVARLVRSLVRFSGRRWRQGRRREAEEVPMPMPLDGLNAVVAGCQEVASKRDEATIGRIDMLRQAVSRFELGAGENGEEGREWTSGEENMMDEDVEEVAIESDGEI
ncbi:hypothetical protein BZA70DRAFT_277480 [Myxozyma melibiosi]|uniref:USP domain-containing protein n=1 Tax=Myxozyma melibiosi TaxID=54550 RepID=A0ABR1F7X8_9ASCO